MRVPLYEQNERDDIGGTELIKERDKGTGGEMLSLLDLD